MSSEEENQLFNVRAYTAKPEVLDQDNPDPMEFLLYFSHHGEGYGTTLDAYNKSGKIPELYEKSCQDVGYTGQEVLANLAAGVTSVQEISRLKVIDIAAGTGAVGKALHGRGFRNITAHDGAQSMLDYCQKSGAYIDFLCCPLDGRGSLPIADGTYDIAACSASFVPDHLPLRGLEELARVVKPGGYFINVNREGHLETEFGQQYEEVLADLEAKGTWKKCGRLYFPKYNHHCDGIADIYRVC